MRSHSNLVALLLAIAFAATPAQTQQTANQPAAVSAPGKIAFEVVSVKPNRTDQAHPGSPVRPDGFDGENQSLSWYMVWAFGLPAIGESYFSGLPSWVTTERFDLIAKVAGPDVPVWQSMSNAEKGALIHDVLVDRFKLQTHIETHQRPIYGLVLARGGAKLTPITPVPPSTAPAPDRTVTHTPRPWFGFSRTGIVAGNVTMEDFAADLSKMELGRPVQDRTGLTDRYNLKLDFAPINPSPASAEGTAAEPDPRPDIFTAVQDQLGLKLESSTGPVVTMAIDHIERPTPN
jgi:uncharacterized protein (TIGR03435 family)